MKRRYRIALVAAFSVSGAIAILGLSALGDASEGPLSAALGWIGAAAGIDRASRAGSPCGTVSTRDHALAGAVSHIRGSTAEA